MKQSRILVADHALSVRLEMVEGAASADFIAARRLHQPETTAEWRREAGAYLLFDGVDSPLSQSFGLGLVEELTPEDLESVEAFFTSHGAELNHEVSPLAGLSTIHTLCDAGYRPSELTSVMYLPLAGVTVPEVPSGVTVRIMSPEEGAVWARTSADGWAEFVEYAPMIEELALIGTHRKHGVNFFADIDGLPVATGGLSLHDGVALFAGASTLPDYRCRGAQSALLAARLAYARAAGCDLGMMCASAGSSSQRNAQRAGFLIAYTRTKWTRRAR